MKPTAVFSDRESEILNHLKEKFSEVFRPDDRITVKLHMGEPGNKYYIKSDFTRKITDILMEMGCRPFIFDSPVTYRSPRGSVEGYSKSAAEHGYNQENMGVPVVISDRSAPMKGRYSEYQVVLDPMEADGVVLLTHFKGHVASGMGGSIKNVGMGCMSKETKEMIHSGGEPEYQKGCTECGTCVENCPTDNIELREGRPFFDQTWCPGCSNCVLVCPESAIKARLETFGRLIADAACTAHAGFKKTLSINVMKNITKLCDCIASSGPVILDDVGFMVADDMLTADIASLKMVEEVSGQEDFFKKHNLTSGWHHVDEAAEIMGRDRKVDIKRL